MPKQKPDWAPPVSAQSIKILLDTHIAVWLADGNARLKSATTLLKNSFDNGHLFLSPISAWEIGLLVSKNRLDLGQSPLAWFDEFVQRFSINILEVSPEIAINSSYLPGKFRGDPADRIIIATAIAFKTAILSADKDMISYGNMGFVHVISC
jgi:PIN domain nuclease of toxin-antitoxin system